MRTGNALAYFICLHFFACYYLIKIKKNLFGWKRILWLLIVIVMAMPGLFLFILGLLKQTMQFSGTTNKCKNLAINYPVLGFEPTTSHEWVSSHNHYKDHYLYYLVDRYIATRAIAYALSNFWQNNPMLIWLLLMIKSYYSRAVVLDKWSARSPSTLKIRVRIPA